VSFLDEQPLAFGAVAERYERARPGYPSGAIDEIVARGGLAAGDRVLEVGAGTGKATEPLAARGLAVTALEPSPPMAALLRTKRLKGVTVVESEFESWRAADRFAAVVSVQTWHWIEPEVR
jgi:16S rRNA A1518/A1519 N6-dimethyltransferase RsmA/KsgA/DIM1 with predicted DNA glycosylase/AP lyase activity